MHSERLVQRDIDGRILAQAGGMSPERLSVPEQEKLLMEPEPKVRQPKGMTYKKLYRQIESGFGQGHGAAYQPWLQIRRRNPSPHSNQVVSWLPPLNRTAHFFSRGEYQTALLFLWLSVHDLREQFPLWPVPHPHPLVGGEAGKTEHLPWSRGLLAIAKEAGIRHGNEFGTRQPYVATMDLTVTIRRDDQLYWFTFSSKPLISADDEIKWRTLERLELERRYAREVKSPHAVTTSALVPIMMAGHLEWWLDCSTLACRPALTPYAERFAERVQRRRDWALAEAIASVGDEMSIENDDAWLLFRHCAWTQKIDIDPSKPIVTSYPIQPGGRALRSALRRSLFQGEW
jgi:hypothetical protein